MHASVQSDNLRKRERDILAYDEMVRGATRPGGSALSEQSEFTEAEAFL